MSPAWRRLQRHPNADIDFFRTVLESRDEIERPHIIVIEEGGMPIAMLIGRIDSVSYGLGVGYKTLFRPHVRMLTIVQGGCLGDCTGRYAAALADELVATTRRREVDMVFVNGLRSDADLMREIRMRPSYLCRDYVARNQVHWKTPLAKDLSAFLKGTKSKHRYWMRRMGRLLDEEFPGQVRRECYTRPEDVDRLCLDAEIVARQTYQRGLGAGFVDDEEHRRRMNLAAAHGWLRGYILYAGERPRAFWIGTLYQKVFHLDYTGYDTALQKFEPGTVLFLSMVEDLCSLGVEAIDFGFGDAFYKQRFGRESWQESAAHIFAPTFKGVGINVLRTLMASASGAAQDLVKRFELLDGLKKSWRGRLAAKERATS